MRLDKCDFSDITIDARSLGPSPVTACTNLRRSADYASSPALEAVGMPRLLLDNDSLTASSGATYAPLAGGVFADGIEWVLLAAGEQLAIYTDDTLTHLGSAGATPRCAVAAGMELVVMTDSGAATVAQDSDGAWTLTPPASELPGLHLFAGEESVTSGSVAAFTLATPLPAWGVGLGSRDLLTLTTAMLDAYSQLDAGCISRGSYFQPVLARVKLYDESGTLLSVGPVTCLAAASPWAATQGVEATVSRDSDGVYTYVGESVVTASTFKVCLELPAISSLTASQRAAASRVAYAEVYVTPQSHTADYGSTAEYRQESGDSSTATLRTWMPGASVGNSPRTAYFTEQFRSLACVMDALEQRVATVTLPFGREEAVTIVTTRPAAGVLAQGPEADLVMTAKALAGVKAASSSDFLSLFALPHHFSARAVCVSGDNVVWANLRRLPFAGYDADSLSVADPATTSELRAVEASVRVTVRRSGGSRLRVVNTGPCRAATAILPALLTYPDASASLLELRMLMADGSVREFSCDLEPSADGTFAYWLSDGLAVTTVPLSSASYTPYEALAATDATDSGMALRASSSAPVTPLAVARVADSPVLQVLPSWGANANWDYACGRFYLLTRSGVMALAINSKGALRASLIDPRPAASSHAGVLTPHGVIAAVGRDLVTLSGSKAVTLLHLNGVERIGYDHILGELWACTSRDVTVVNPSEGTRYMRSLSGITAAVTAGSRLLLADSSGLRLAGDEEPLDDMHVEWTVRAPDMRGCVGSYLLEMDTDGFDGMVTFAAGGTGISFTRLDGPVHKPLCQRLLGPRRTDVSINIRGHITPPFTLTRLRLTP